MAAEIVEDDDIAGTESWCQALLDPSGEGNAVDRAIEHEGCDDAVVTQPGEEGQRLPMAMRYSGEKRLAALTPAAGARHVGFDPGFVDEHQAARIKSMLMVLPTASEARHLRPVLFAGDQRFFKCLAFPAQETPNGVMRDIDPGRLQIGGKRPHRPIGLGRQPAVNRRPPLPAASPTVLSEPRSIADS